MTSRAAVVALAITLLWPSLGSSEQKPTTEQKPAGTELKPAPCTPEAEKFCKGVAQGPELTSCLLKHTADLSRRCRKRLDRMHSAKREPGACAQDRAKLCADVKPGKALAQCLRTNEDKLSPACKAARQREKLCRDDAEKFCSTVRKGGGRIPDCLRAHLAELSADCKAALTKSS